MYIRSFICVPRLMTMIVATDQGDLKGLFPC